MRRFFGLAHRYLGLITAMFLFIAGATGAVISWDHELDDWLNPHLHKARAPGPALDVLDMVRLTEQRHPEVSVGFFPLAAEEGESLSLFLTPRNNPATGRLYEPGFNQVFIDPATGEELGRREWGSVWPITKETVVSFLYKLHYTLHFPEMAGTDRWGIWLMGIIAIGWTLDCFVGFYLTLPARRRSRVTEDEALAGTVTATGRGFWQRWKPAWLIRWGGGNYKLNYDLHRAFSLWTWALLFILAFTAFSLNLYREVFFPMMSTVSKVTPTPFDQRKPVDKHRPIEPQVGWARVIKIGRAEGERRGWAPLGAVSYANRFGIYQARYFAPGDDHGAGGVGPIRLFIDGQDGRILGERLPWNGTAADIFVQAQFPLHSGRILGLPGRILISVMGVIVAMLSVTGVIIWWKKRKARIRSASREAVRRQELPLSATVK